ncbi:MAG: DUF294 nucleotidyltransferase-like domain-containing protein [Rhodoferax sp.]
MPNAFHFAASPFDTLTPEEQRLVRAGVDVVYFPQGQTILGVGESPRQLYILIKGFVTEYDGDDPVATYGPDDSFDGRALVAGRASHRFVATEEVVAYALAQPTVQQLIAANAAFGALLFAELGHKLQSIAQRRAQHEWQSLTLARVDQAFVRPVPVVPYATPVLEAVRTLQQQRANSLLVDGGPGAAAAWGLFTSTALQRAVLDGRALGALPVGEFANFDLVRIAPDASLGDAMALMLKRRVRSLVVCEGEAVRGVLEALDLFSYLSNQSHLLTERIEAAADLSALAEAAAQINQVIAALYRSGTRIHLIAAIVQQLNARLFERAWALIAPPELVANSCLFVMGSEGRGEQLLKTDQDNGLILRDGYTPPAQLDLLCLRFSQALQQFGYPPCPGSIMLSNPLWRQPVSGFGQMACNWLLQPSDEDLMHLAIFMDAHAVCGDASLLAQVQQRLRQLSADNDALLARFAAAIDVFSRSSGWWNRLLGLDDDQERLHLKKAGLFPLVHGVRALALAQHIEATGTEARIQALVARQVLDERLGQDLVHSLHFFMGLKLRCGLQELDTGHTVSGAVDVQRLSTLDRDLLKDTLGVVKRFRARLRQHFRLESVA